MPIFLEPSAGLSFSEAYAEAAIAANITRVRLVTYELWHDSMEQPVRVVVDTEPLLATLEVGAPRNENEEVAFIPADVQRDIAEESDRAGNREIALRIENVSGEIKDLLDRARVIDTPEIRAALWEVIERVYMSDDLSGPHILPVFKVTATRVVIQGDAAIFNVTYRDSANTAIPAITFTPEAYPTLQP